jgi:hypothetical protein
MEIDDPPESVLECGCSICRRLGVLWAYYSPQQVRLTPPSGATAIYTWGRKSTEFHTCKVCGCTTHWSAVDKSVNRMGVNARLMDPEVLSAASVVKSPGPR